MKKTLITANWKLNGDKKTITNFLNTLQNKLKNFNLFKCNIIIAPPVMYLDLAEQLLYNPNIYLGAQNVDFNLLGAYTGDISAEMLKDIGVTYVIIGHSERKLHHKENDEDIAKKFYILKKIKLIPIICIGENKIEKEQNLTQQICIQQINTIINNFGIQSLQNTILAYEPTWAIGTGKSASPIQVQKIHQYIRKYIAKLDPNIAEKIIIQYGGSVNINNIYELLVQPDIDGILIGHNSLNISNFYKIIEIANNI